MMLHCLRVGYMRHEGKHCLMKAKRDFLFYVRWEVLVSLLLLLLSFFRSRVQLITIVPVCLFVYYLTVLVYSFVYLSVCLFVCLPVLHFFTVPCTEWW